MWMRYNLFVITVHAYICDEKVINVVQCFFYNIESVFECDMKEDQRS